MELTIHAYGYAYYIFNTLNAIAMIRNSNLYAGMINVSLLMVGAYYAIKMAGSNGDGEWKQYIRKVLGMVVLVNALLLPKVSMNIKDHVEKHFWRVDNIPLAFALPVGVIEEMGHLLTMGFEQAFSVIGGRSSFDYYNYGTVFGARLAREVMQVHVRSPEYISNMKGFIERCVIMPAMIGDQFTKEELVATKDMWGLVSSKAGTFTRVPMTIHGKKQSPSPTCKEAVPYFEKKMSESANGDIVEISIAMRAPGADVGYNPKHNAMNEALKNQISALYGNESSVENILKHNIMINALNNYRGAKYPAVKAALNHEAGGFLSGDMADKVLTSLLSIFKNLIYGSFIFVVPLIIFAGGMGKYRSWITICFSLQLWPPLYAMLNMMIDLSYDPAHIVSYSSWSTETKQMDKIASMAAHLSLLIPIIAVYVTRLGEGGLLHIAGSLMSSASGGVAAGAGEQASGTRSYDNESIGNHSSRNVSSNKYDDSMQYVSGGNMSINRDGSFEKILPSGRVITLAGGGSTSSSGESVYRQTDGISSSLHEGIRTEHQLMASESAELSNAEEKMVVKEASALATIAQNTRTENGYNIDTSTEEGREVVAALNSIDEMSKNNNYSWQQNAEGYLRGEVNTSGFGKVAKNLLGIDGAVGGKIAATNSSEQQDSASNKISSDLNTTNRRGVSARNNKHESWLESVGIDKSKQDSMRESFSDVKRLQESVSSHKERIEGYNKGIEYVQQHGSEYQKDMTQDVIDQYSKTYGVSDREAEQKVREGAFSAKLIFRDLSEGKANEILSHVTAKGAEVVNSDAVDQFAHEKSGEIKNDVASNGGRAVDQFAKDNNIKDYETATNNIDRIRDIRENEFGYESDLSMDKYDKVKSDNNQEKQARDNIITKHEANRIGRGKVATKLFRGLGRPPEENIEENGSLKIQKPASEDFDKDQARKLLEGFKPRSNYKESLGDNQYVDPRKIKN